MNETDAVVVRVEGDHAWVRAQGQGHACGACAQKDGCQAAAGRVVESALGQPESRLLCLPNPIRARPGDAVVIRARDGAVLRAAGLAYGLPLLLALCGALAGLELIGSEPAALVGMLLGLGAGIGMLRFKTRQGAQREPILSIGFK
ncbi:MAG: SoxR reducing system RseC family protein [Rhodocyclaceae bacterium]|jgi:sigma-E factor negative regulatory protein RseC|nr:SoxR reducing system RseC family protein [Rhodocyclaceae bacterium]